MLRPCAVVLPGDDCERRTGQTLAARGLQALGERKHTSARNGTPLRARGAAGGPEQLFAEELELEPAELVEAIRRRRPALDHALSLPHPAATIRLNLDMDGSVQPETDRQRRFDELFAAYSSDIVAYCGWRAGPAVDAQDAVADVFLTAWRRLDDVPEGDAARVWLYATARRVIANHRRSSRRRVALAERLAHEAARTSERDRDESLVHDALLRLAPRDREVLLLAEWEELTPAEIAKVLGCLGVTARARLHRARRRFRAAYEEVRSPRSGGRVEEFRLEGGA
jgi:RNA polymerase sigma-70 factor, ECF subfamily